LIGRMSNVLVLGGTSWLGGEIAKAAVARAHHVTCLARGEAGDVPAGVTFVRADRDDPDAYAGVLDQRWDLVLDVSWQPRFVRGAVEALAHIASHWTYVSSVSAYADVREGGDEDAPLHEPLEADSADSETYGAAKVRCEQIVRTLPHTIIARAGLLAGPGDRSDRFGYWVSRFALAGDAPVLVPDAPKQPTQVIDARDFAVWLVESAAAKTSGVFNAVGPQEPLHEVIDAAAVAAGFTGEKVPADPEWLAAHDVEPWAGPRSLPLWIPGHDGIGSQNDARIVGTGIRRRPLPELLRETLEYERSLGLDRARRAGLARADELELIEQVRDTLSETAEPPLKGN
jgi:2'-hydroxyisoflavone reductase